jgi:hypothetical protein
MKKKKKGKKSPLPGAEDDVANHNVRETDGDSARGGNGHVCGCCVGCNRRKLCSPDPRGIGLARARGGKAAQGNGDRRPWRRKAPDGVWHVALQHHATGNGARDTQVDLAPEATGKENSKARKKPTRRSRRQRRRRHLLTARAQSRKETRRRACGLFVFRFRSFVSFLSLPFSKEWRTTSGAPRTAGLPGC